MKIEDISKIYELLGKIRLLGFISLVILISISLWILTAPYKPNSGIGISSAIIIITIAAVALCTLYFDARSKTKYLQIANFIIQDMVGTNFKQKPFSTIHLPYSKAGSAEKKEKILMNVINEFPEQFSLVPLNYGNKGIAVIDSNAVAKIDSQWMAKAEKTSLLLSKMLLAGRADIVFVDGDQADRLTRIDREAYLIGQDFFKILVGKNDLQPIYDPNNNDRIIAFVIPK